jgi:hypothetical protein
MDVEEVGIMSMAEGRDEDLNFFSIDRSHKFVSQQL